jgi:hypothetical protein
MNQETLQRLAWQLPVLLLLPAVFSPETPWRSPAIGWWPLWLAAMPVMAWLLAKFGKSVESNAEGPASSLQVLVFPAARRLKPRPQQVSRHAA